MAGAGRRRRFPTRTWIRRRTWSKQRGAKLRSSSSESDGNPDPVVKPLLLNGDAASKLAVKVGGGSNDGTRSPKSASDDHDVIPMRAVEVRDGGDGGCGCDGSPNHIVEAGGDDDNVSYSPMLGCCCCNQIRKHLVAEEGGCEGSCPLNFGSCDSCRSLKHAGRSRLRVDPDGQLYVLDSEAEDSALEETCRVVLRRGQGAFRRRLAATGEVASEAGTTKATAVAGGEMTVEFVQYMVSLFSCMLMSTQMKWVPNILTRILTCCKN